MAKEVGIKFDAGKPRWGLLPFRELKMVVKVLTWALKQYPEDNWKIVKPLRKRYVDAGLRHFTDWIDGERYDPDSGFNHLAHAVCCMLFFAME